MKKAVKIFGAAAMLSSCTVLSTNRGDAQELEMIYAQRAQWVQSGDVDSLFAQMMPDYRVRLRNGTSMNLQSLRERWSVYYERVLIRHIHFIHDIKSVEQRGDTAVVTIEQKDKRIQNGPDGRPREVEADVLHTDTWIRTARGWKLQQTVEGRQTKFVIDGKPQPIN